MPKYQDLFPKSEEVFARRWDSFSGADMKLVFDNLLVGTASSLSVTITRDTVPRYVAGDTNPRAFVRGRRGIAGTMTFSIFDRDPLLKDVFLDRYHSKLADLWNSTGKPFGYNVYDPSKQSAPSDTTNLDTRSRLREGIAPEAVDEAMAIHELLGGSIKIRYVDQLPPIDVSITFANEAGAVSA